MSTIMPDPSGVEAALAHRLRLERQARDWSLTDLANRSGVSRTMLSKIERQEASPTAALLGRLSAAFGLTLSQLFARTEDSSQLLRTAEQPVWRDPETGFLRRSLSPHGTAPLDLVWGELPPGARIPYPAASYTFIADQQLVVIDGGLTIRQGEAPGEVQGKAERESIHELGPGDCFRFGPPRPVTFENTGRLLCRYIVAILRSPRGGHRGDAPR